MAILFIGHKFFLIERYRIGVQWKHRIKTDRLKEKAPSPIDSKMAESDVHRIRK